MIDAARLQDELDKDGVAVLKAAITPAMCAGLAALYDDDPARFRSTIVMARHGFGRGEYKYFARPLPPLVQSLREALYPPLSQIANAWAQRLGEARRWPAEFSGLEAQCAAAGQTRPTPLLLRYGRGDHNRLHQDLYGPLVFPLQAVALLDAPERDFEGGDLVLVEGQPRRQSRAIVPPLRQGDIAIFAVRERPVPSARGWARASLRHGVSEVRSGLRRTLGIIFHDAA